VWLVVLALQLLGIAVGAVFALVRALLLLPRGCWLARLMLVRGR